MECTIHACSANAHMYKYTYTYIYPNNGQKGYHDPKDCPIVGHESAALPRTRYTTRGREAAEYVLVLYTVYRY